MGSTSISVPNESFTAASYVAIKKNPLKNMRDVATFVAVDAFTKGKELVEGGHKITVPFSFENHSLPTQLTFETAYAQFNTFNRTQMQPGHDDWASAVQPVFISGLDAVRYSGPGKLIDVASHRVLTVRAHFMRSFEAALIRGAAATGSWAPGVDVQAFGYLNTFNGIDFSTGIVEETGSGNNTVHNISRSSFPAATYPLLQPIVMDLQNAAGVYLIDQIVRSKITARRRGVEWGSTSAYASDDFIANMNKVLRQPVQYVKIGDGETLTDLPMLMGKELMPVTLPYDGANSATYKMSLLMVPWKNGVKHLVQKGWDAEKPSEWKDIPMTADCKVCLYKYDGQIIADEAGKILAAVRGDTY